MAWGHCFRIMAENKPGYFGNGGFSYYSDCWNNDSQGENTSAVLINAKYRLRGSEQRDKENRKAKMTRQEAIKKLIDTGRWSTEKADLQVSSLEALGLIKFEEEKKYGLTDVLYDARLCCINDSSISQKQFIDYLAKRGYKIVKEQS